MLGFRLDPKTTEDLTRFARREGRTKSAVVRDALRDYLAKVEDDQALLEEVRAIAALTCEGDLRDLDAAVADLLTLVEEEEAALSASRAA